MKVVYVSKASRVAAHRDKLARLAEHVDLTLVLPARWGGQPDEPAQPGDPRTVVLPAVLHGHNHFHFYRGLGRVIDAERPHLVHADEEPYSAVTAQIAALCARRRVPFVFFAWQNIDKRLPPPFGALRRAVFERAAGGIAGTDRAGAVLRAAAFRGPLAIIPQMGVDPARFRPNPEARARVRARLGIDHAGAVVGYVGRLIPEKGVDLLLRAAAGIPDVSVLIVGEGPERERLGRDATVLGLERRVRFAGAAPSYAVAEWLAAMDVLALPSLTTRSWSEQFGRVLVEAMASGVPVVGSDSGEIPAVIGSAGVIVPEGSEPLLRDALARLLSDGAERARLARAGRERVLERFTQDAVVRDTLSFYQQLLASAPVLAMRPSHPWSEAVEGGSP